METLLTRVTGHAMNYAIRSGITITATYAARQCGRLLKETPRGEQREQLLQLQRRLENKVRIISPAIDMIELISARGNTTLDSAVNLTKEIRYEIQKLGTRLSNAANEEELLHLKGRKAKSREESERELSSIIACIQSLLVRIEDAVPMLNLAITTSGVSLSTKLSGAVSPSRLLQASTFVTSADSQYILSLAQRQQVGPTLTLSMYMLFAGHARQLGVDADVRDTTWKEVLHKARVKLMRVPLDELYCLPGEKAVASDRVKNFIPAETTVAEFAYQLVIVEDLDDDRFHDYDDVRHKPGPFEDIPKAGILDVVPIHEISKVFYADTGKILNIGEDGDANSPVLLLKRDVHAEPPRRMLRRSQMHNYFDDSILSEGLSEIDGQQHQESLFNTPLQAARAPWRLPEDLDPEWMAFEVFAEEPDPDSDSEPSPPPNFRKPKQKDPLDSDVASAMTHLKLSSPSPTPSPYLNPPHAPATSHVSLPAPAIKTSISLLEMLLKLTALQQFRQESHLAIEDELLNFFLENSATAGAGPDKDYRQRLRHDAIGRVGFDPYDESPIKRRGEAYIQHPRGKASPRPPFNPTAFQIPHASSTPTSVTQLPGDEAHYAEDGEGSTFDIVIPEAESTPYTRRDSPLAPLSLLSDSASPEEKPFASPGVPHWARPDSAQNAEKES